MFLAQWSEFTPNARSLKAPPSLRHDALGMNSLNAAKPIFNRAAKKFKKRV